MAKMIVVEGIEGAGKSSVLNAIQSFLVEKNISYIATREPGGTEIGEKLRSILKDKQNTQMHPKTELLLMYASRNQLLNEVILPSLADNIWVVSDRFELSSYAYQGFGRGLQKRVLDELSQICLDSFKPDKTFFLDVSYETSQTRVTYRGEEKDRFENEAKTFFERIRSGYLTLVKDQPTVSVIDASRTLEQVIEDVIAELEALYLET